MDVLHVITTLDPGGAERQLVMLANKQQEQGIKVNVVYLKGDGRIANTLKIAAVFNFSKFSPSRQIWELLKLIRKTPTTIICAHLPRAELLVAFVSYLIKFCFIVTKHNTEHFWPNGNVIISKVFAKLVEDRCCAVVSISESVKQFLIDSGEFRNRDKYTVIYYGIEPSSNSNLEYKKVPQKSSQLDILTIARLAPQKNLRVLIKAMCLLRDLNPNLRIAGEGPQRKELEILVSHLNLTDRVEFLGVIDEIDAELEMCDVFVLPSRYEGFGLVLLEALNKGVRIVASDLPVVREVLGGSYKYLFDFESSDSLASAVRGVLKEPYTNVLEFCRSQLEEFTLSEQVFKTSKLYSSCMHYNRARKL